MKSKKLSYNKILVLFCIIVVSVPMTGCDGDDGPIVLNFSASPSTINPGESSTLTWNVSDADTVNIIPDVGTVASSGSTSVSPEVSTTYTLSATNSTGIVFATVTIYLPPVHNLTKNTYYNTIQAALDDANSNDTIEVFNGTYDETIYFPSGKKIILQSVNGPFWSGIRGDDNSHTVNLDSSLPGTTIKGFTITHTVGLIGGGIFNDLGNLIIDNCTVSNNDGGGILNYGTLAITGASTISGNNAYSYGGGIYNWGTLTITASAVSRNSVDYQGGGIYIYVGSFIPTIGGYSRAEKNTICGNYKSGNDPSLDQQIRGSSGDFYDAYKDTNDIYADCP